MEHRINVWIQRLVVPCAAIPTVELRHFGLVFSRHWPSFCRSSAWQWFSWSL